MWANHSVWGQVIINLSATPNVSFCVCARGWFGVGLSLLSNSINLLPFFAFSTFACTHNTPAVVALIS